MADEPVTGQPTETPAAPVFELDPRFKTVEDQAKAYKEAEKKMTQEAQRRSDLERQVQELQQTRQPAAPAAPAPEPDLNEIFWKDPVGVLRKVVDERVDPFFVDRYEMQKSKYASDPNFKRYEAQIDSLVKAQPELKKQPGIVDKMYRVVQAMEFNPEEERKRIEAEVRQNLQTKQAGAVEGVGVPPATGGTPTNIDLSPEERKVAAKFYPDLTPEEANKKYAENKVKWLQGA